MILIIAIIVLAVSISVAFLGLYARAANDQPLAKFCFLYAALTFAPSFVTVTLTLEKPIQAMSKETLRQYVEEHGDDIIIQFVDTGREEIVKQTPALLQDLFHSIHDPEPEEED